MEFQNYDHLFEYKFGKLYCYENYVVGQMNSGTTVNNENAMRILTDVNSHYKKNKIVFISNREFGHNVDPKVYKLVNAKIMVGIAIVGTTQAQKIQAANEQSLYAGSFGYFNNIESAIEWANSFSHNNMARHTG